MRTGFCGAMLFEILASTVAVNDIAATPAVIELKKTETANIKVIGIKGGLYSNVELDSSECTFDSDTKGTATVDAKGAVKAVAVGTAIVTVKYGDATDIVKVTVSGD